MSFGSGSDQPTKESCQESKHDDLKGKKDRKEMDQIERSGAIVIIMGLLEDIRDDQVALEHIEDFIDCLIRSLHYERKLNHLYRATPKLPRKKDLIGFRRIRPEEQEDKDDDLDFHEIHRSDAESDQDSDSDLSN